MTMIFKPNETKKAPLCEAELCHDTGDNFLEMLLKPNVQFDEPDKKEKKRK